MARKVTCPHCNAETYDTPSCGRCGGALGHTKEKLSEEEQIRRINAELVYKRGMFNRAQQIDEELKKATLAKFTAIQKTAGVDMAGTKIVVERDRRQFVYTAIDARPVAMGPGRYELGKIILAGGGKTEQFGCLRCEVSETPIPVTFVFPDLESMAATLSGKEQDPREVLRAIQEAITSLNLRTSDNRLGGALLQLRLRVFDPIKLVRCHDAAAIEPKDPIKSTAVRKRTYKEPVKPWYLRAVDWLTGHKPAAPRTIVKESFETGRITLHDLYRMIRYELYEAISNSIRDMPAKALYDRQDSNREQVRNAIKKYMQTTLESFGLQIPPDGVVAFQFRSPEYEEFLQRQGDASLAKQNLENERAEADVRRDRRDIEHQEFEHVEQLEEHKDIHTLNRGARQQEAKDQIQGQQAKRADELALEKQTRQIQMEQQRLEFDRRQRVEDEELEDERQHKKALQALEYQRMLEEHQMKLLQAAQNADHARRIEAVNLISGKPAHEQFLLAMQYNPELQKAFIAMQQARAGEDRIAMAQQFQGQIQQIYGQQSEQSNALLMEAARQLGVVQSAQAKAQAGPGSAAGHHHAASAAEPT